MSQKGTSNSNQTSSRVQTSPNVFANAAISNNKRNITETSTETSTTLEARNVSNYGDISTESEDSLGNLI